MEKRYTKSVTKETIVTDKNTGEILEENIQTAQWKSEPEFVKLYLEDISKLIDLPKDAQKTILALLRKMNYDNQIVLAKQIKTELAATLNIKTNTFEHSLGTLVKKNVLLKKGNNVYLVNPFLFGKGSWKSIQEIRMTITYNQDGRLIEVGTSNQLSMTPLLNLR